MVTSNLPDILPVFKENILKFSSATDIDVIKLNGDLYELYANENIFEIDLSPIAKSFIDTAQESGTLPTLIIEIESIGYTKTHYLLAGSEAQGNYPTLSYIQSVAEQGYSYQYPYDYSDRRILPDHAEGLPLFTTVIKGNTIIKKEIYGTAQPSCNAVYIKWLNSLGGISHHAFKNSIKKTSTKRKYITEFLDTPKLNESIACYDHIKKEQMPIFKSLLTSRKIHFYESEEWTEVGIKKEKVKETKSDFVTFEIEVIKKEQEL